MIDDIFGPPSNGVATSDLAADAIRPSVVSLRDQVALAVWKAGSNGLTDEELADECQMNPSTVRPRRGELVAAGRLVDLGERRKTKSGRSAIVWHSAVWVASHG